MSDTVLIPIVLGTARKGCQSEKIAQALFEILEERTDIKVKFVDVKDYTHGRTIPPWENNEDTKAWRDIAKEAKGFLLVVPEYNHGYPGELKLLLDQELEAYRSKPVAICTVSRGGFGGVRVYDHLLPVLHEMGFNTVHKSLPISKVEEFERDEHFEKKVHELADALLLD